MIRSSLPHFLSSLPAGWATFLLLATGFVASLAFYRLSRALNEGRAGWTRRPRAWLGVAPAQPIRELKWLLLAVQTGFWVFLAYVGLTVMGLGDEAEVVYDRLLGRGFMIGGTHIVPVNIFGGLLWFLLLVTFMRWVRQRLEADWLPLTRMDPGARESTATLFGYAAFAIAAVVGLSAAGVDFAKIAIVAGALSVGIGFGLQNIVNNFVSGLILLFERPMRSGDYVRINGIEGFVRKIRIRATEIETWEKVSVIVPNSLFVANALENWDYRNDYGRVVLKVGVDYDSDAPRVKQILLECARAHPQIIQEGEIDGLLPPLAFLVDFADSALNFELRAYVRNVQTRLGVASDLRFAVLDRFRAEKVVIPFPQQVLHMPAPATPPAADVAPGPSPGPVAGPPGPGEVPATGPATAPATVAPNPFRTPGAGHDGDAEAQAAAATRSAITAAASRHDGGNRNRPPGSPEAGPGRSGG